MSDLVRQPLSRFLGFLKEERIRRFYFVWDQKAGRVRASHPALEPVANFLGSDKRDFDRHEGLFLQLTEKYDSLQGAFVHRTCRGQAQGGTRFWNYNTLEDFLRDGVRLSRGMTLKNAMAQLWWGGGKGVMSRPEGVNVDSAEVRRSLFRQYGELVTSIGGAYITAEDVGTTTADMAEIFNTTRFITCIPSEVGGSGNPSLATARGVVRGIQAGLQFVDGSTIRGKKFAVQGMGNVATPLIEYLLDEGAGQVVACDIHPKRVEEVCARFKGRPFTGRVSTTTDTSIFSEKCDVFAPCATGAILNPKTIPLLQTRIVCGAANNQLEDAERDGKALLDRGITYLPDFMVNRMGIVNCANEQYGSLEHDPYIEGHLDRESSHSVYQTSLRVLGASRDRGTTPHATAVAIAEELSRVPHPIFGHRGQKIIDSLVANPTWTRA